LLAALATVVAAVHLATLAVQFANSSRSDHLTRSRTRPT
jgi:hypothetical protein